MSQVLKLKHQAIKAAKDQDWETALLYNQKLLELKPFDIGALNRTGATYLQLHNPRKAQQIFKQVLEVDPANKLAHKHLERIKNKQSNHMPTFSQASFIEEPGKAKSVELYRLAGKKVLEQIRVGQKCQLEPKNRYISVTINDTYIGSLPEDLSFRLTKLITTGNTYECLIQSGDKHHCTVHLKELSRSPQNQSVNSFPKNKDHVTTTTINEVDESMLEEDIPVEMVDTDTDQEKTIDDIETPEE